MHRSDNLSAVAAPARAPASLLPDFAPQRVTVVGDAILDGYIEGTPREVCREAPVPVIDQSAEVFSAGGAANVALNVSAMGAQCTFACAIGADADGEALRGVLERGGVRLWPSLMSADRVTVAKRRVVADGQTLVRVDRGRAAALAGDERAAFLRGVDRAVRESDIVIVSDYRYGLVDDEVLDVVRVAAHGTVPVVGDSREPERLAALGCDVAKPNRAEAARVLGVDPADLGAEAVATHASELMRATGARLVAVTLDADGVVVVGDGLPSALRLTATRVARPHPAGAGDTFLAAFTLMLRAGRGVRQSAEVAVAAAGVAVAHEQTVACTREQLEEALNAGADRRAQPSAAKLVDDAELMPRIERARAEGRRVVFTNGCFDLLHNGHADLLARARALGGLLVVAVNDDGSVRAIKGPERPVMTLGERVGMLAALSSVDVVVPFPEPTAERLVRLVRPDVYVKGDDGDGARIPELAAASEVGAEIRLLPHVIELSTSSVMSRITGAAAEVSGA